MNRVAKRFERLKLSLAILLFAALPVARFARVPVILLFAALPVARFARVPVILLFAALPLGHRG